MNTSGDELTRQPLPASPAHAAASQPPGTDRELVELVLTARAGDSSAWIKLIGRFDTTLRNIAGSCRLASADVDDVVQTTWLALLRDFSASLLRSRVGWRRVARRFGPSDPAFASISPMMWNRAASPPCPGPKRAPWQASAAPPSPERSPRFPTATTG